MGARSWLARRRVPLRGRPSTCVGLSSSRRLACVHALLRGELVHALAGDGEDFRDLRLRAGAELVTLYQQPHRQRHNSAAATALHALDVLDKCMGDVGGAWAPRFGNTCSRVYRCRYMYAEAVVGAAGQVAGEATRGVAAALIGVHADGVVRLGAAVAAVKRRLVLSGFYACLQHTPWALTSCRYAPNREPRRCERCKAGGSGEGHTGQPFRMEANPAHSPGSVIRSFRSYGRPATPWLLVVLPPAGLLCAALRVTARAIFRAVLAFVPSPGTP